MGQTGYVPNVLSLGSRCVGEVILASEELGKALWRVVSICNYIKKLYLCPVCKCPFMALARAPQVCGVALKFWLMGYLFPESSHLHHDGFGW